MGAAVQGGPERHEVEAPVCGRLAAGAITLCPNAFQAPSTGRRFETMTDALTGSCLCGDVTFEITGAPKAFQYCHCSRCRKVTGTAHGANFFVAPEAFRWTAGEPLLGRYEHPDAKHFATSFCTRCGSALPWLTKTGQVVVVPAGSVDSPLPFRPTQSIHWASHAAWYVSPSELPVHDVLP